MIFVDASLLLYAYDSASSQHAAARSWLENKLSGSAIVGLPLQSVTAFLRIATNPSYGGRRYTMEEAVPIVDSWLQQPNVRLLTPGDGTWPLLRDVLLLGQIRGPMVTDAQFAALTI